MGYLLLLITAAAAWSFETGSQACATCHAEIYKAYMRSGMARSSGAFTPKAVVEQLPGMAGSYRISADVERVQLSFPDGARSLDYFVGSGSVGRSYLSHLDGFLFQSPVSWYTGARSWDISPGFEKIPESALTRAIEPGCLRCHSSRIQSIDGTVNKYKAPAFLEGGVSCERCHGPGEKHVVTGGGSIINPAKLDPARRDSVCAQCHLSGATEITRLEAEFRAGQLLTEKAVTFVWSQPRGPMPVISHFERMSQSKCRQAEPEKFWCGTCHNPHSPDSPAEKTAFYRQKCMTCHSEADCKRGTDCISCHMPKTSAVTVQHAAFTDHSIPRTATRREAQSGELTLVPFGGAAVANRELALAWADVALRENNRAWGLRAFQLLQAEYQQNPNDAKVGAQLAQLYDRMGQESRACTIYERVVAVNPSAVAAAINLGTCRAKEGRLDDAMKLWAGALERNPAHEGARMNLAVAQFQSGDVRAARATLNAGLKFNPASRRLKELLARVDGAVR